jgi:hypothetical protein
MDHSVKEVLASAHMRRMSNSKMTLVTLAAAAVFLSVATGCSDGHMATNYVITPEERAAYEKARFGTPEAQAAADQELARMSVRAMPQGVHAAPGATATADVLLYPAEWPARANGKLCEYTAALINNADRDGNAVPDKARAAAKKILNRC